MKINTQYVGDHAVTTLELTEAEVRYSDQRLARIAFSQDRLRWTRDDTGTVRAEWAKLRHLPRSIRFAVARIGAAASVVLSPV